MATHHDSIIAIGRADLLNLALALALGLLIGVQRGWVQRNEPSGTRFAGVRTFGLIGLIGGISGLVMGQAPNLAVLLLAATAALVVIGYWRASRDGPTSISGTTSLAGLLTVACGFLAGSGSAAAASAVSGIIVVLLGLRSPLHRLVRSLDEREVKAITRFALIALVILPLLPNTPFGPYGAWRPRSLWLVVVLVSGFSFAGYLAAKWLGPTKGTLATAATGSMVSSTAVTAAMAARHRAGDGDPALLNAAIALASAVMFVRVMVLTAALAPLALPTLAFGAVPGTIVSLIAAVVFRNQAQASDGTSGDTVALRNPFDLGPAILLMALVMALTAAAHWVLARFGDRGLAVVLAITGTADVDSAIITLGSLPSGLLTPHTAGLVLLPPILLNTLFKAGVTLGVAGWRRTWPAIATLLLSIVAALAGVALTY